MYTSPDDGGGWVGGKRKKGRTHIPGWFTPSTEKRARKAGLGTSWADFSAVTGCVMMVIPPTFPSFIVICAASDLGAATRCLGGGGGGQSVTAL